MGPRGVVVAVVVAIQIVAAACSQPAAPTIYRIGPVPVWGQLTSLQTGTPIQGALVSTSASTNTVLTDAAGAFRIEGDTEFWSLDFVAEGFLPRRTHMNIVNPTGSLSVNAISLAAPFSLEYYRQAVRGVRDHPDQMFKLKRWTQAPRFFFLTRTLDVGDAVPDAVIDKMEEFATRLTPRLTGGRFVPLQMARGTQSPTPPSGWIVVQSYTNGIPDAPNAGGDALVGENPGRIRLLFRPNPNSSCGFGMAGAFFHEIVHALGFWHVDGGFSVKNMCDDLQPALEYHAAIAYARPVGNTDPDIDFQYYQPSAAMVIR